MVDSKQQSERPIRQGKYANLKKVVILGMLFLIGYIPFMTVQNLMSEIEKANDFESLGF